MLTAAPVRLREVPAFARYIGIDYSGAQTPNASLPGLRVYLSEAKRSPVEVLATAISAQILEVASAGVVGIRSP